jgi:hypothetical protein
MIEANPTSSSLGIYTISLNVSDSAKYITSSFELTVNNTTPKLKNDPPPSPSFVHGGYISMPLSEYFVDDDGDQMTMTATYTKNAGG